MKLERRNGRGKRRGDKIIGEDKRDKLDKRREEIRKMCACMHESIHKYVQYQSKVCTHLLIQGFFFIFTMHSR